MADIRDAVIVSGVRLAQGKAGRGTLKDVRPDDMAAAVIREAVRRAEGLDAKEIDDLILGCSFPEGEQGLNVARIAGVLGGLPTSVPAFTINRFCSSGLQAIALAAADIKVGWKDIVVAGGVENMSRVPMGGHKPAPNPALVAMGPEAYIAMGHTAENVCSRFEVTREQCDAFAVGSHQKAWSAIQSGRFKDEILPLNFKRYRFDGQKAVEEDVTFDTDEGVRPDTTLEGLAKLKPVFRTNGAVTAGNSSQTTDGAAAVVLMSDAKAAALSLKPMAIFRSFAVGGVDPDVMGIGPIAAVPKALKLAGLTIDDMDIIELNEAFASQSVYVMRHLGMDPAKVNLNGGAIALGHPLGCSGARLTVTALHEAQKRKAKYGLVTMCIGGGMGAAGVLEFIQ